MSKKPLADRAAAARSRLAQLRHALGRFDLLCSGNLSQRMMKCGKASCRCATDPSARHGPYYEWARMRAGKPTHRYVSARQAEILREAIDNYRQVKKLLRSWEEDSERIIDADYPPQS